MAERGSPVPPGHQLDFQQLLSEAQQRWLRPAEICEILSNYQKFHIAPEPPSKPPSGSLFLFDRKVLRYFRKDGHNWRKKKDGKTIKEAHEKLKVGSVDVLHCYYAHGEENENFQRRSYWMLEPEPSHIVFVHYLEVKGNKTSMGGIRETDSGTSSEKRSPMSFSFPTNNTHSGNTNSTSPTSTLSSLCEDADSDFAWSLATDVAFHLQTNAGVDAGDSHQASSRFQSYLEPTQMKNCHVQDKMNDSRLSSSQHPSTAYLPYNISTLNNISPGHGEGSFAIQSQETLGLGSWEEVLRQSTTQEFQSETSHNSLSSSQPARPGTVIGQELLGELLSDESTMKQNPGYPLPIQSDWQNSFEVSPHSPGWSMAQTTDLEFAYDLGSSFPEQRSQISNLQNLHEPFYFDQQNEQFVNNNLEQPRDETHSKMNSMLENGMFMEGKNAYTLTVKKQLLGGEDGLKKVDSFSRWMTKELGEVTDLHVPPTSGISWSSVECGEVVDESSLSPSLSQEQLFSIIDFSPKWAYAGSETEVLITGIVLKNAQEVAKHNWSCMFGEVEVPIEVLADGILYCICPPHAVGHVPFYVTRSNRLSCSEVREFEFRERSTKDVDVKDIYSSATSKMHLHLRLERFLSLKSVSPSNDHHEGLAEKCDLINKIILMKEEEDYNQMLDPTSEQVLSQHEMMEKLLEKRVKEKLYSWLLHKVSESGKGPSVLDSKGQGLLHLAAALGYDWAIKPTVAAGVSINFRDVNGWTALHWAASCGREETVAFLVSLGAAPGLLTDPSPEFPLGRAPADLASSNGHKGISGFLAESSLTSYFLSLTVNDAKDDSTSEVPGGNVVQTVSERTATPVNDRDEPDVLSLKDSLTAVCNATQAADRIHQVFRMRSFQRKQQLTEFSNDELGLADEYALSLAAGKSRKPGPSDGQVNSAAVQIQKKYRGWKKRKEFLIIRQRIVKIQAHVRGHQVRKQYKAITWSVGILEKVILRWRRKGSGLRGFRPDALPKEPDHQGMPPKEDDYDFLKEGRKQTEERLQKALTRVKSMVQYPEARAQYRRLLNVVEGINETKVSDMAWNQTEDAVQGQDDLFDIDSLLDDDTFMSIAFE